MIFTPRFEARLGRIHDYISEVLNSPKAADDVVNSIMSSCTLLKQAPYMGMKTCSEKKGYRGMRYIISGKYLVLYRVERGKIIVSSIIDTRTNEASVFLGK